MAQVAASSPTRISLLQNNAYGPQNESLLNNAQNNEDTERSPPCGASPGASSGSPSMEGSCNPPPEEHNSAEALKAWRNGSDGIGTSQSPEKPTKRPQQLRFDGEASVFLIPHFQEYPRWDHHAMWYSRNEFLCMVERNYDEQAQEQFEEEQQGDTASAEDTRAKQVERYVQHQQQQQEQQQHQEQEQEHCTHNDKQEPAQTLQPNDGQPPCSQGNKKPVLQAPSSDTNSNDEKDINASVAAMSLHQRTPTPHRRLSALPLRAILSESPRASTEHPLGTPRMLLARKDVNAQRRAYLNRLGL